MPEGSDFLQVRAATVRISMQAIGRLLRSSKPLDRKIRYLLAELSTWIIVPT
jgi:hypothetical protein